MPSVPDRSKGASSSCDCRCLRATPALTESPTVPLVNGHPDPSEPAKAADFSRVLVVEDNVVAAKMSAMLLEEFGYDVPDGDFPEKPRWNWPWSFGRMPSCWTSGCRKWTGTRLPGVSGNIRN